MEKRGVFILMPPFPGPLAPFNTPHADTTHMLVSEKATFTAIFPGKKKWGESSTELIIGWETDGEKENFLSLSAPPPRVLQLTNRKAVYL